MVSGKDPHSQFIGVICLSQAGIAQGREGPGLRRGCHTFVGIHGSGACPLLHCNTENIVNQTPG